MPKLKVAGAAGTARREESTGKTKRTTRWLALKPQRKRGAVAVSNPSASESQWAANGLLALLMLLCVWSVLSSSSLMQFTPTGEGEISNSDDAASMQSLQLMARDRRNSKTKHRLRSRAVDAQEDGNEGDGSEDDPAATGPRVPDGSYAFKVPPLPMSGGAWAKIKTISELSDYECVAWRMTGSCRPDGRRIKRRDRQCDQAVQSTYSGYCEVRHKKTRELRRVLPIRCRSWFSNATFTCGNFQQLVGYNLMALEYQSDVPLSYDDCQQSFRDQNTPNRRKNTSTAVAALDVAPVNFDRGIVTVVYQELFLSVYASIRWLRDVGCKLPIELWYLKNETNTTHPVLTELTTNYGAFLREIKDPRATKFYTKIYATYYSAFDQVLLLDADNFAVRDPTYLFSTPQYESTGALFWPDFWRPSRTIFGMTKQSFVWEFFGIPFVDMFEQESGQVVINRRRHGKALNALLHYGLTEPRFPAQFGLVWGDKDLFRFAWMRTASTFHMIEHPPGAAGMIAKGGAVFCGQSMVQHDPFGEILFLHRNMQKLTASNRIGVWTHVQQFKLGAPIAKYDVRGEVDTERFPMTRKCYGKHTRFEKLYDLTSFEELPFARIEPQLIAYVTDALAILAS